MTQEIIVKSLMKNFFKKNSKIGETHFFIQLYLSRRIKIEVDFAK